MSLSSVSDGMDLRWKNVGHDRIPIGANSNLEDALLIVRSPDLFCRREALRFELEKNRRYSSLSCIDTKPKRSGLIHLQRGLGLVQSKTLKMGNPVGFGSSQPRLAERKSKQEHDHICDRLVRSLTPTKNVVKKWWSLEGIADEKSVPEPQLCFQRRRRRTSSNEEAELREMATKKVVKTWSSLEGIADDKSVPEPQLCFQRRRRRTSLSEETAELRDMATKNVRKMSAALQGVRVLNAELPQHSLPNVSKTQRNFPVKRRFSGNTTRFPWIKPPLVPILPIRQRIAPYEKVLKVVSEEFLNKKYSDKVLTRTKPIEKRVHFDETDDSFSDSEILTVNGSDVNVAKPVPLGGRKSVGYHLEAQLLPSLTIYSGASDSTKVTDLIKLLTQEIPKVEDNKKLLEEIENESFDLENFVQVVSQSLGNELGKALEYLKPVIVDKISEKQDDSISVSETIRTKEKITLRDAAVMTSFESSESPDMCDASMQDYVEVEDIGTQYGSLGNSSASLVDAATSYSRHSVDAGTGEVDEEILGSRSLDKLASRSEEIEYVYGLESTSPPRDPSFLPPPCIDVTAVLDEKENILEKIEQALSIQSSLDGSTDLFDQSMPSIHQDFGLRRHVDVQTDGFKRVRSVTKRAHTFQVFSSSSLTESSSSYTCRETTESEEVTTFSGLSLSEGEIKPYRYSPGEVRPRQTRGIETLLNLEESQIIKANSSDDLPRLLTLERQSERTFNDGEIVILAPPTQEFCFVISELTQQLQM